MSLTTDVSSQCWLTRVPIPIQDLILSFLPAQAIAVLTRVNKAMRERIWSADMKSARIFFAGLYVQRIFNNLIESNILSCTNSLAIYRIIAEYYVINSSLDNKTLLVVCEKESNKENHDFSGMVKNLIQEDLFCAQAMGEVSL